MTSVAAMGASAVAPLLFVRGIAGLGGVWVGGVLADRWPRMSLLIPSAVRAGALAALWIDGANPDVLVVASLLSGIAFSALTTALGSAVLKVAPRNVNLAAAGLSAGVNVGIAGGSLVGSLLVSGAATVSAAAVAGTVAVGAVLTTLGLVVAVMESVWPRHIAV